MKFTRQLRLDALATGGTAPIQLTITWEGNRLPGMHWGRGVACGPMHTWQQTTSCARPC